MKTLSIKMKIALAVVGCLVVIAVANALLARYNYDEEMQYAADQAVRTAAQEFVGMEKREVDKLSTALDALVGERSLAEAYVRRDREALVALTSPVFAELKARHGVTHWYFLDPPPARTCFLRVHRPDLHGDVVGRATLKGAIATNATSSGKELGQTAFALRVVRPYMFQGKLLGYMELGQEIDDFLARMKADTGDEFALVIEKRFLDARAWAQTRGTRRNNWGDDPDVVTADVTNPELPVAGTMTDFRDVPDAGRYLGSVSHGERQFVRGVVPVLDAAGQRVGGLFVLHDVSALRDRARGEQVRVVLLMASVAIAVLAMLFILFQRLVFRRLERMTEAMENVSTRLAGGDYDVGGTVEATSSDEIGRFEAFLGSFLVTIGATLREFEKRIRRGA